jgi:hypothetical protein
MGPREPGRPRPLPARTRCSRGRAPALHHATRTIPERLPLTFRRQIHARYGQKIGDQKHIDVHDDGEVWYWTYKFGVSKQQLVAAVREVGTHTEDVAIQLGRSYP